MSPCLFMENKMRDLPQQMAMQQLQGSSDCAPITRDELVEMFGEDMPIEAVNLLRNTPGCMTIGEVRVELRKMAMQQLQGTGAGQMSDLVERLRGYRREPPQLMLEAADRIEALEAGLSAAVRAANLALFVIRKHGVMPNDSWKTGFEGDMEIARAALAPEQDK